MKVVLIILAAWLVLTIIAVAMAYSKIKRFGRYNEIYTGMEEKALIDLMGKDFEKTELPKYTKYEWKINNSKFPGINRVDVKVVKGKVSDVSKFKDN